MSRESNYHFNLSNLNSKMNNFQSVHCCKPFVGEKCSTTLRKLFPSVAKKIPQFREMDNADLTKYRICHTCEFKVKRRFIEETARISSSAEISPQPTTSQQAILRATSSSSTVDSESPSSGEESLLKKRRMLEMFNKDVLPHSPIYLSHVHEKRQQDKIAEITSSLTKDIAPLPARNTNEAKSKLYDEMMNQLKEKFHQLDKNCDKICLLTVLPASLTEREISEEFNCSRRLIKVAKDLLKANGPLSKPEPKKGIEISEEVKKLVAGFYDDDEVSRIMPGKNDCISIRRGDEKIKMQKRLMMSTLKESYEEFKKQHPSAKIGFSKFCLLRPKYCVQPGTSGTHSVCVCTIHQNVKLMMFNTKFGIITNENFKHYKDCISAILCKNPKPECYFLRCSDCRPGIFKFKNTLRTYFENHGCEDAELQFNQWISTDRCNLETVVKPLEDFLDYFIQKLEVLIPHYFISMEQANFLKEKKNNLKERELIVYCDFAENYSFILQNEAQGYHWNKKQATIHPFVIYYRDAAGQLQHLSFTMISDCLNHDSVAVNLFILKLINFVKDTFEKPISKIFYITDGAASQYKNKKNFINAIYHRQDFGIDCEWHFHATSHGKGPCDGIGGTLKRKAARASLTKEYEKVISSPKELYDWATAALQINVCFATVEEYEEREKYLEPRFRGLQQIKGTRQFHAFIPADNNCMNVKLYSNTEKCELFKMYSTSL